MTDTPDNAPAVDVAGLVEVRDARHALELLDDVDILVRFCSVSMTDVDRYNRGSWAFWSVAHWIAALPEARASRPAPEPAGEVVAKAAQIAGDAFWNLPMPKHWDRDKQEYTEWCTRQSKFVREQIAALRSPEAQARPADDAGELGPCPTCSGDCGSANPPVMFCPMQRIAKLETREKALREIVQNLAAVPRGGDVWNRSDRLNQLADRARATLQGASE